MDTTPLNPHEKQPVEYCIPLWLRDEQVRSAIARPVQRLQFDGTQHTEPIAVVGYGPSLADTWEQIRTYRYVISCSGSHKFLLDRGLVPTWHIEVDPRPHKVALLGPPHPDVQYLVASACHPAYFDHLAGADVRLWHVFSAEADVQRLVPRGEWAITGGASVGLRAMTMARMLGFTDLQVFGMDGCVRPAGTHAAEHPNPQTATRPCEYNGVTYQTTPSMLECARQTTHELDMMPDVRATFHGEGLLQAMMRDYVRTAPPLTPVLGVSPAPLISAEYRAMNAQLHRDNLAYGVGGGRHAETVQRLAESTGAKSVLDYGCGKGYLAKALPWPIWEYDPAIPEKAESPRPADLVVCTDVLEHIEPDKLGVVLDDLRRCVGTVGFFTIHTGPASKTLPDGRNTHLIQQGREWWERRLGAYFSVGRIFEVGPLLYVVVSPKAAKAVAA